MAAQVMKPVPLMMCFIQITDVLFCIMLSQYITVKPCLMTIPLNAISVLFSYNNDIKLIPDNSELVSASKDLLPSNTIHQFGKWMLTICSSQTFQCICKL